MKKINLLLTAIAMVSFISLNACKSQGSKEEKEEVKDTTSVAKQETKKVDTAAVMEETDTTEADTAEME